MSDSALQHVNVGAYEKPYSGVGIEFYPLGVTPERSGVTLHESGFLPENRDWNFPSVFSPFWRLYYNSRGGHRVVFGDRMVELTPQHIMLIPEHCLFHCLGGAPVPTLWLAFSCLQRVDHEQEVPILLSPTQSERCLIRDLSKLIERQSSYEPTPQIYRYSLALLHVVLSRSEIRWRQPPPQNVTRVMDYIEQHLRDRMANPDLARRAGMSVEGFARAFRRHLGVTPGLYVTQVRVGEACRLLIQTATEIDDIAEQTGFPNRAYFSRVFKRITGQTPAAFRKRHAQPHPTAE